MQKTGRNIKKTLGHIVKPVGGLTEIFNFFMKKVDEKTSRPESSVETGNFVTLLLEEMKDAEQGIFAFFTEFLFMQHLTDKMVQIENEVALAGVLGERLKDLLKPGFIEIFLSGADGKALHLVYHYPSEKDFNPAVVADTAKDSFSKGESRLYNQKNLEGKNFSVLAVPLRTTRERFGTILAGKKGGHKFSSEETTVIIAATAVVSFAISNIKLMHSIIKNERLVTIGETMAGLSHDIRNMLNNFENGIALIDAAERQKDGKMLREGVGIVRNGYERVKNLMLSMVDYSKTREMNIKPVDINRLLENTVESHRDLMNKEGIKIEKRFGAAIPLMHLDPERMDRMFSNLIQNSIDAVKGRKGLIKTGTRFIKKDGVLEIWIKDNGAGIPEGSLDKIFDIFYSTKGTRGTGFGLAIVQKIVKEHNGNIRVESSLNKGTGFYIKMPAKTSGKNREV